MYETDKKSFILSKKFILLITILFISIFIIFYPKIKARIERHKKEKYLSETFDTIYKNFNVKFDKKEYEVVDFSQILVSFFTSTSECYQIKKKKKINYKLKNLRFEEDFSCEYMFNLKNVDEEKIEFFKREEVSELFYLITYYGFGPYFFNELIYDKSKGNDFEQIEKIFLKYKGRGPIFESKLICNDAYYLDGSILNINRENECNDVYLESDKDKKFEKYFSIKRDFNKIDWYDFKKSNDILPVLRYTFELDKKELEKILEEIKPYYNKNEFIIVLVGNNGEIVK